MQIEMSETKEKKMSVPAGLYNNWVKLFLNEHSHFHAAVFSRDISYILAFFAARQVLFERVQIEMRWMNVTAYGNKCGLVNMGYGNQVEHSYFYAPACL